MNTAIQIRQIELLSGNPARFLDPFTWRIRLEVLRPQDEPIEMAVLWVDDAESDAEDQLLSEFDLGPLGPGLNEFTVEVDPPELRPNAEVPGVSGMYMIFKYKQQRFLTIGYYVNVAYATGLEPKNDMEAAAFKTEAHRFGRLVLLHKPLATPVEIHWDSDTEEA